ncbi:hypothetical protein LCGC14_0977430 [marine sediment metagenome]|uniref:VWFA domain-containing protein n=1 Tax=marine sediment metagenome TaxID=412755 RepID=A0A0F9NW48_9ZZZZ
MNNAPDLVVGVVLDESGSMGSHFNQTIQGYNSYLNDLKKDNKGKNVLFSLTKFNTNFNLVHTAEPLENIPELSGKNYKPGGMTSLYDAVANTVIDMEKRIEKGAAVLIIIMTDGHENSSSDYQGSEGLEKVRELLTNKTKEDNWTFVFLGADADAWEIGISLGTNNSYSYDAANIGQTLNSVSVGTQAFSHSVARGTKCSSELSGDFEKAFLNSEKKNKDKPLRNIDMKHKTGIDNT